MKQLRLFFKLALSYVLTNKRLFLLGVVVSIFVAWQYPLIVRAVLPPRTKTIGMIGNYTLSTLPRSIQEKISFGLVKIASDGAIVPAAAIGWQATSSGEVYTFKLNKNLFWQDGKPLTSAEINYNFKGVEIVRPDDSTVKFILKEPFAPLLSMLSQPLFKNGLVGLGDNRMKNLKLNGRFLSAITLTDTIYKFYPTQDSLITALKLGSIQEAVGLHNLDGLGNSRGYSHSDTIDDRTQAIIFFNNQKKPFDDKTFRQGLVYALPDTYPDGSIAESPFPKDLFVDTSSLKKYSQNLEVAKKMTGRNSSTSAEIKIKLSSNRDLENTANLVAQAWRTIGITTQVEISDMPPVNFDAYLTYVDLPVDPDQYALWHSTQTGNIAGYKSFKVDKLLEEGRKTIDPQARKEIYANFAKAITEDVPVAFLFYPRVYSLYRK